MSAFLPFRSIETPENKNYGLQEGAKRLFSIQQAIVLCVSIFGVAAWVQHPPGAIAEEATLPDKETSATPTESWPGRPLSEARIPRLRQLTGLGAMLDLSFPYYQNRSPRGLAKEIRARGFSWVCVFAHQITPEIQAAFHEEGLAVAGHLWGTIIYDPKTLDPPAPDDALQVFVGGPQNPNVSPLFYCSNSDAFIDWYRTFVRRYLEGCDLDLLIVGEAFLGSWAGPAGESYGCFCPNCLRQFKATHPGVEGFPEFKDETSPRYWKTDPDLYRKWVDFRAATTARFAHNAYGELIRAYPDTPVAGYMLAVDDPDGIALVRERNGQDIDLLPDALPYDFFLFQAHWPDWIRPDLDPVHHALSYKPFLDRVRAHHPHLRIGMTTDTGSQPDMRRSMPWINTLHIATLDTGFDLVGIYEYAISKFIYEEAPQVIEITSKPDGQSIEIVFSKRMDPKSVQVPDHYTLDGTLHPTRVHFDGGNIATLTFDAIPKADHVVLRVKDILDDRATFWFNAKGNKSEDEWVYAGNAVNPNAEYIVPVYGGNSE